MEELRAIIAERAPRWHEYYHIDYGQADVYIGFCGEGVLCSRRHGGNVAAQLVERWRDEWTKFEQADWLAILAHESHVNHIPEYPFISRHFDFAFAKGRYKANILSRRVYFYPPPNESSYPLLDTIEAHLANLASMRVVMAILPTTIMRAVLAHI
jgi:hypothetical protein